MEVKKMCEATRYFLERVHVIRRTYKTSCCEDLQQVTLIAVISPCHMRN